MIIDLQRRLAEAGRIRIGQQVKSSNGKRPAKLDTFRLTSSDRTRIQQASAIYGGQPNEWEAPAGKQWEVITESDALNVIVPPSDMAFSQHYELWSGGGCQRRCNGAQEQITEGPCLCDPERRECSIHTRLSVMLRDLPGLGVWRIDSQGWYAALELQGAVGVVQMAAGRGQMLPARLRLEQRMVKRPGQQTRRFAVPVLDIEVSPAQLMSGAAHLDAGTVAIEAPRDAGAWTANDRREIERPRGPITPVPESVPEAPAAPVAEQAVATKQRKPRKNAAQPVARTGIKPRTAAEAARGRSEEPPLPDEPPPDDSAPPRPEPEDPGLPATPAQNRKMHACFREAQLTERPDRLAVTSSILGFDVKTSAGLTIGEASKLIDTLERWLSGDCVDDQKKPISIEDKIREILNNATLAEIESSTTATEQES